MGKINKIIVLILFLIFKNGIVSAQSYIPTPSALSDASDGYCEGTAKLFVAYDSGDFSYIKKFCSKNKKDPFFFSTCKLLEYSAKLISSKEFVQAFPGNKTDYDVFASATWGCAQPCKIFGVAQVGHPIFPYYEALFNLMASGDRSAIKKVLGSKTWVDGELAEYLLDAKLPKFWEEHADVVLKNWDIFGKNLDMVGAYQNPNEIQKLKHMKEVVLKTEGDQKSKIEFLRVIEKELSSVEKNIKENGS